MSRVIDAILRLRDEFSESLKKSINLMTSASKGPGKRPENPLKNLEME